MEEKDHLGQQLYDRASAELDAYITNLKQQPVEKIIDRAYELATKQDMLMLLEDDHFSLAELRELCKLEHPLQVIYGEWIGREDSRMQELADTFTEYAGKRLQDQAKMLYADPKTTRYTNLYVEARQKGEDHLFRASKRRDQECMAVFSKWCREHPDGHGTYAFMPMWAEQFGLDRCKFVLGYSVQRCDWDARYSQKVRKDVAQFDYHTNDGHDYHTDLSTNIHPCIINGAYETLMGVNRNKQKTPPVKEEMER